MQRDDFLGGVVEGFYGQPWTQAERLRLFGRMGEWGLNTYFYSPKDDLKHRAIWRECYSQDELARLRTLVEACAEHGLRFIYGLSPGLDIRFGEPAELDCIKARFAQLIEVGARHFALLFDDLPGALSADDRRAYDSVAAAQCAVTNAIFRWLRQQSPEARFLFCPTVYCDRMDRWQLAGPGYLETVGRLLDRPVDVLWTGPEIVSAEIPLASVQRLAERIGRPPVIWDNLHANDYDQRRLYCGPYTGRAPELRDFVRGILANPNNEFPINYIPLRTLAAYLGGAGPWRGREAFLAAAAQWLADYGTVGPPLGLDDLILLADCYYLPFEEGPGAEELHRVVEHLVQQPVDAWAGADTRFEALNGRVQAIFERLTELRERELFYAWSRRAWELKEQLQLVAEFLAKKKSGADCRDGYLLESYLPGTWQGGLVARLQRLLPMDGRGRFRPAATRCDLATGAPSGPEGPTIQ